VREVTLITTLNIRQLVSDSLADLEMGA